MNCPKCHERMIEYTRWDYRNFVCGNRRCLYYGIERVNVEEMTKEGEE